MAALHEHIAAVQQHPLLGTDIDFKLAVSPGPRSAQATAETGFSTLTVSLCKVRPRSATGVRRCIAAVFRTCTAS